MSAGDLSIYDPETHARLKGMWAGALTKTTIPDLQGAFVESETITIRKILRDHTPALLKIFDEGIVNATDHEKSCRRMSAGSRVTKISVALDFAKSPPEFSIENDGPGIPVTVNARASEKAGQDIYNPEAAFSCFFAGTNMEKPADCVKGGINGIGAKLMNVHSRVFTAETFDGRLLYVQRWKNRLTERGEPMIVPAAEFDTRKIPRAMRRQHTKVMFTPAYDELGYPSVLDRQDSEDLDAWIRLRMYQAAMYVGPGVAVEYNGSRCEPAGGIPMCARKSAKFGAVDMLGMICRGRPSVSHFELETRVPPGWLHGPWDIAVGVDPAQKKFAHMSVVNGAVPSKGTHLTYVKKAISSAVQTKLRTATKDKDKTVQMSEVTSYLTLVFSGAIAGADWTGQRKDELQISEAALQGFVVSPTKLDALASKIVEVIMLKKKKRPKKVEIEKYTQARNAGTSRSRECSLLAAEGDSAIALLREGLTVKRPGFPSFDNYGVISLHGVIMNAMRETQAIKTSSGQTVITRSVRLEKHAPINALAEAIGLDFDCRYETEEEIAELNYGALIGCVDQDLDGCGKILPLLLVAVFVFWPNLIRAGFVKRFLTPVVRVFRGGRSVAEFSYEDELRKWIAAHGGDDAVSKAYQVKYYKGLASHKDDDIVDLFGNFQDRVYTFTISDASEALFRVYFDRLTGPRKLALSSPVSYPTAAELEAVKSSRTIACSMALDVDTKAYKLDDIQRKIPHAVDGLNISRRKILAGAIKKFRVDGKAKRVYQLAGFVADKMCYHHGDASLSSTIIGMAQKYPGARRFPFLIGEGQFGTRHMGGDDAGSPRYVSVRLAGDLVGAMFPPDDSYILDYNYEESQRAEPRYFVPVLPMCVLEHVSVPSEGWKHVSFARDVGAVADIVRRMLDERPAEPYCRLVALADELASLESVRCGDPILSSVEAIERELGGVPISLADFVGTVRETSKGALSFGDYVYDEAKRRLTITELPMWSSTQKFIEDVRNGMKQKPGKPASKYAQYFDSVEDYSGHTDVAVQIKLKRGAWEEICAAHGNTEVDPVEDLISQLHASVKPFLNFVNRQGAVMEFGESYLAPMLYWFPFRRDLYRKRLERERVVLQLRIAMEKEVCRYVGLADDLGISDLADDAEMNQVLSRHAFLRFNKSLVESPKHTPIELLESSLRGGAVPGASYEYILNLAERERVKEALERRSRKILKLEADLAGVETLLLEMPFAGVSLWRTAIDDVMAAVKNQG